MTAPDRVVEIFSEALERPAADRPAYLESACGGEAGLRAEVESLLAAHDSAGGFMDGLQDTARAALLGPVPAEPESRRIGPYRTLHELGRGGMGVVYLAERAEGGFEQRVALKLIKRGMDSDAIVGRFLRERQILAALEHPSVARLVDGGVTPEGQPYFAMEYVDGTPLTEYSDTRRLGIDQRLRLFEQACRAVQYAHGQLVVHRDLKPSNILVTTDGRPKLLDFGVAKMLQQDEASTALTRTRDLLLTPEYAAPEQLRGAPVTTATDVYALGVILFELLTGAVPFPAHAGMQGLMARALQDEEAPEPSSAVLPPPGAAFRTAEEHAAARGLTPRRLARRLQGDLDVVVQKALRRDPMRRYASAEALAEDVRRHLAGHPVQARGDTMAYRAASFVRRHRVGVAGAAVVLTSLLLGLVGTAWQAQRARREAQRAQAVQRFLVQIFESADPTRSLGETVTARQLLDEGARRLDREAADDPAARAELADTLARTYRSLGLLDEASRWSGQAVAGFRTLLGPGHARTVLAELTDAEVRADRGEVAPARAALDALLPKVRAAYGEDAAEHTRARVARAALLSHTGEFEKALGERRAVLAATERAYGPDHVETAACEGQVATALLEVSRFTDAEVAFRSALARLARSSGAHSPQGVGLETAFAEFLDTVDRKEEAEPHFEAALRAGREVMGPRHPQVAQILIKYGFFLTGRQDDRARAALEEAVSILEPLGHYDAGAALRYLGFVHMGRERFAEARDVFVRAEEFLRAKLGADHPLTRSAAVVTAFMQAKLGQPQVAERRLREQLAALERLHGPRSNDIRVPRKYLGEVLRLAGRPQEAEAVHRDVLALERELFGVDEHLAVAATKNQLALDLLESGRGGGLAEARRMSDEAVSFMRAHDPAPMRLGDALITSGRIALAQGDRPRARRELEEALRLVAPRRGDDAPSTRLARRTLAAVQP